MSELENLLNGAIAKQLGRILAEELEAITPEPYDMPEDGYDWCASCQNLAPVADTYAMDDGSRVVPLCAECVI